MKKNLFYFSLILLTITLTTGCTILHTKSTATTRLEIMPHQWVALPTPAQLPFNIKATQILTAKYIIKNKTSVYSSQVQIEKTPDRLVLVAIAGWGGEIFSINYDGSSIKSSSLPMPNSNIGIKQTLTDFILTYAPQNLLRTMLKTTDIKLIIKPRQRIFTIQNIPITKIDYATDNPWKGDIVLQNFKYHYTIKISTVALNP